MTAARLNVSAQDGEPRHILKNRCGLFFGEEKLGPTKVILATNDLWM